MLRCCVWTRNYQAIGIATKVCLPAMFEDVKHSLCGAETLQREVGRKLLCTRCIAGTRQEDVASTINNATTEYVAYLHL
ncbi:hypothetical protein WJX79_005746 [Trebouxia sp. C0005]